MERGKFIVIYGANNLGKSTQMKLLRDKLKNKGKKVKVIKYPIYDLKPTGPILNKFLREKLDMDELSAQKVFAQNRKDYQPQLEEYLKKGYWVLSEDYKGTGICWGATHGVPLKQMIKINENLIEEDLAILLDGDQYKDSIEKGHHNEDSALWRNGRKMHLKVGEMFGWQTIDANQDIDRVKEDIWKIVNRKFFAPK